MNSTYFIRLPDDLQAFVSRIEDISGLEIEIEVDESRAGRNPGEPDPLACIVNEVEARLLLPSPDYFPEGSVLHELLHMQRFLVERVPQIAVCEDHFCPELESAFAQLDNNLEHLVIVPRELEQRPNRKVRWSSVMNRKLSQLRSNATSGADRDFLAIYIWFFTQHVLRNSDLEKEAALTLEMFDLKDRAMRFCNAILPTLASKEAMIRICVEHFSLDVALVCLDYFDSKQSTCRHSKLQ